MVLASLIGAEEKRLVLETRAWSMVEIKKSASMKQAYEMGKKA